MKRLILLTSLLAIFLLGSAPVDKRLVKLTVINKSGEELFIRLNNIEPYYEHDVTYAFTIPVGTKTSPVVRQFTIYRDIYNMQFYYVKEWDPVYQYSPCGPGVHISQLNATTNQRLTFTRCTQTPPQSGEKNMQKIWQGITINKKSLRKALTLDPLLIYNPLYWTGCYVFDMPPD